MKKILLLLNVFIFSIPVFSQINSADSTVQVIGYWNKNEKQSYIVTENSFQVKNSTDTINRQLYTYNVDVEITDSTENSYVIKWLYTNFNIKESYNPVLAKLITIGDSLKVVIKTDEYGSFVEVLNWEEGRDFIKKSCEMLKSEFNAIPNFDKVIDQITGLYSSKESIENSAIEEIHQFYAFHGVKYKLGEEINADIKIPNNYGGEPFDALLTGVLEQINAEDDNAIFRMWQTADSKQVTDAAYKYIKSMQETLKVPVLDRKNFPVSTNDVRTASSIDGDTGWPIFSIQTKEIVADNILQVKERSIELQ